MKRTSKYYVFTADVSSAADMLQIEEIKRVVRNTNQFGFSNRVVLKARRPRVKQWMYNPRTGKTSLRGYNNVGDAVGGLANATSIDVYVYKK